MLIKACVFDRPEGIFKRKFFRLFVLAFAFIVILGFGGAPMVEGQDNQKASRALLAKAKAKGSARIIVRLNTSFQPEGLLSGPQAAKAQQARISRIQTQLQEAVSRHHVKSVKKFKHLPFIAMKVDSAALDALMANSLVVSIEEDVPVPPTLTGSVPLIKADQAWSAGYTGAGWAVAILDTGVDKTHSFFPAGKIVAEACFSTKDDDYPSTSVCPNGEASQIGDGAGIQCGGPGGTGIDGCQHGTHVAGIAAGKSATINGVAKDANIIAVQVFSSFTGKICTDIDYTSPCALSFSSDQLSALDHVYSLRSTYNIASVNMSLGGGKFTANCDSDSRKDAINTLRSAGIATVVSSGNDGYTDGISAPACISAAVSVGSTTKTDIEASFSNYHPILLSLFAPGYQIYSSIPGGGWETWSGTSMAAPHVTGAWAILKQKSPAASVTDLLNILQATGAPVAIKAGDLAGGAVQRINVLAALDALVSGSPAAPTGLTGSASSIDAISISWTDNSADETGFKISRKTGAAGTYSEIGTTSAGVTTFSDSGLSEGTTYHYRVRAYNGSGDSAYSNGAAVMTWLEAPGDLAASAVSTSKINLTWTDNSGAETAFIIKRATVSGGPYTEVGTAAVNETTYTDTDLASSTTYYYRVLARNDNGDSSDSNEASATTKAFFAGGGGGGGGGGCFIATAAFGTPLEKHVRILREFRDRCLLKTSAGKSFVEFYYEVSPPVAAKISRNEGLRFLTRCGLMPFVGMAYLMVTYGVTATLISMLFCVVMTVVLMRMVRRKRQTD